MEFQIEQRWNATVCPKRLNYYHLGDFLFLFRQWQRNNFFHLVLKQMKVVEAIHETLEIDAKGPPTGVSSIMLRHGGNPDELVFSN